MNRYPMHPEAEQLLLKVERQRKRRLRSLDATRAALRKLGRGAL